MIKRIAFMLLITAVVVLGPPALIGSAFELRVVDDGQGVEGLTVT
jgi:hypothetical protein